MPEAESPHHAEIAAETTSREAAGPLIAHIREGDPLPEGIVLDAAAAKQLIDAGEGHLVTYHLDKFKDLDFSELAQQLCEAGQARFMSIRKFLELDVDAEHLANTLIEAEEWQQLGDSFVGAGSLWYDLSEVSRKRIGELLHRAQVDGKFHAKGRNFTA